MIKTLNDRIPLHFHIPKSGGSYCNVTMYYFLCTYISIHFNMYANEELYRTGKIIKITKEEKTICLLFVIDLKKHIEYNKKIFVRFDRTAYKCDIKDINNECFNDMFLFSASIESNGFREWKNILNEIGFKNLNCFKKFLILRHPFDRLQSLFNYWKSETSIHEQLAYMKNIKETSFEDFILSESFENNWILRSMLNISDNHTPKMSDYNNFIKNIKTESFNVIDIKKLNNNLNKIFNTCYSLTTYVFNNEVNELIDKRFSNKNSYKKTDFNLMNREVKTEFNKKQKYDLLIYNNFFKNE